MTKELWEQGFDSYSPNKEVMLRKRKRKTKRQLCREFKEKEEGIMPVIDTDVREGADDITEGVPYEIILVEDITTDVQSFSGIRVNLLSAKAGEGNVVLWKRKVTGTGSKLGVFITQLGNNTDRWLHKWVIFEKWQPRDRILVVTTAPSPKAKRS